MSAPDRLSRFPVSRPLQGGRSGGEALAITECPATLVQVTARQNRQADTAGIIAASLSLDLPKSGVVSVAGGRKAIWVQPGSWLIKAPVAERDSLPASLRDTLNGVAAVVDQSHGRTVFELRGAHVQDVLARICRLDLHDRAFPPGSSAVTYVGHVSCQLCRLGGQVPGFSVIVGSTFAEWLLDQLAAAAASHGWTFNPATASAA